MFPTTGLLQRGGLLPRAKYISTTQRWGLNSGPWGKLGKTKGYFHILIVHYLLKLLTFWNVFIVLSMTL